MAKMGDEIELVGHVRLSPWSTSSSNHLKDNNHDPPWDKYDYCYLTKIIGPACDLRADESNFSGQPLNSAMFVKNFTQKTALSHKNLWTGRWPKGRGMRRMKVAVLQLASSSSISSYMLIMILLSILRLMLLASLSSIHAADIVGRGNSKNCSVYA